MISARYTDCIYKISGTNGSVKWRLGGKKSSFELEGFNFSKQHDARFIDKIGTTEIISFLGNGSADGANRTTNASSALLVSLDISATPMVARVVRRWERPDQGLSHLRGNVQILPNNNAFVAWSDNSYISEHTYDGYVVMEAQFATRRFVTYRAYKSNFTGAPTEPPTLKVQVYGNSPEGSVTVCYVSWNWATEVAAWELHRSDNSTTLPSLIGKASRTGFGTTFQFQGFESSMTYLWGWLFCLTRNTTADKYVQFIWHQVCFGARSIGVEDIDTQRFYIIDFTPLLTLTVAKLEHTLEIVKICTMTVN